MSAALVVAALLSGCRPGGEVALSGAASDRPVPAAAAGSPGTGSAATTPATTPATTGTPAGKVAVTRRSNTKSMPRAGSSSATTRRPGTAASTTLPTGPAVRVPVPVEGRAVDTSRPTRVIGSGTPASCTSGAVVAAVAAGGIVTFDCGPDPVTIRLTQTAKVRNANPRLVLDGGGKVTLSGGGVRRILYQNACDQAQGWTTTHCDDQETPSLVVQNLTFADGDSSGLGEGGGAIFVRGGQFKVVNTRFLRNRCAGAGPDQGGAALRVFDMFADRPVYVVNSGFEGGRCANGGGISSIGVSWVVIGSRFIGNQAIGSGANPARPGTPGGGSGGAIYLDGNRMTLRLIGSVVEGNTANEGGGAVFFVSNDRTGTMSIESSTLRRNPSKGFETAGLPGIFFLGASKPRVTGSVLAK